MRDILYVRRIDVTQAGRGGVRRSADIVKASDLQ